jgi:transcriptional regulator with XRE-family HTH domain
VTAPGLVRWRLERGLTQVQLAKRAGLSRQVIGAAERGQTVSTVSVMKMAKALGVEPRDLMES